MKKVLVISYYYPPIGGVGMVRTLKFTKYLPEFGWQPHVLTVKNRDRFYTSLGNDKIPEQVSVHRSWNILNNLSVLEGGLRRLKITSQVIVPDAYIGWIPLAIRDGVRIIKTEGIDLIYVSCPPFSAALIGTELKRRTGLPLVVDFRDAWTLNPYAGRYMLSFLKKFNERCECQVFKNLDYLITTTEGIKNDYVKKYPHHLLKIIHIPSGFDQEDIPLDSIPFDKFTILYTGYFYGMQSPDLLFSALEKIFKQDLIPREKIQFLWAGPDAPFVNRMGLRYHITETINYLGHLSKKEADALIYRSHLLYLVIGSSDKINQSSTITGKIFSYLASGKPLLATIPEGSAKKMIEQYSDNSIIITQNDLGPVVDALVATYTKWAAGRQEMECPSKKTENFRRFYDYKNLSRELSRVFERIASAR